MSNGPAIFDPRNPQAYLARTRHIESGGRNNAVSSTGAAGPYQFTRGTARQYGLSDADRFDYQKSESAALRLAMDNANYLRKALGRDPTNSEVYLAHQQGPAGAAALLKYPNMPAAQALVLGGAYKDPAKAYQAVSVNGGNPNAPAGKFAGQWLNKFDGGSGSQTQQYGVATNTTPSAPPSATITSSTPQSKTQLAVATPTTQSPDSSQSPVQMASATTPGSNETGYDYSQFAYDDMQDDQPAQQQDTEQQKLPAWETPQLTAAAGDSSQVPFIDSPPTNTGIDEMIAGRLAAGKQRMAGLSDTSSMANLFADAYAANQNIGQAGKSQEELAALLAEKNKNGERRGGIEGFA